MLIQKEKKNIGSLGKACWNRSILGMMGRRRKGIGGLCAGLLFAHFLIALSQTWVDFKASCGFMQHRSLVFLLWVWTLLGNFHEFKKVAWDVYIYQEMFITKKQGGLKRKNWDNSWKEGEPIFTQNFMAKFGYFHHLSYHVYVVPQPLK